MDSSEVKHVEPSQKGVQIQSLINNGVAEGRKDIWLFGHGQNFKAFFQAYFAQNRTFDYGETCRVYVLAGNGNKPCFFPPYHFAINQMNGAIKSFEAGSLANCFIDNIDFSTAQQPTAETGPSSTAQMLLTVQKSGVTQDVVQRGMGN